MGLGSSWNPAETQQGIVRLENLPIDFLNRVSEKRHASLGLSPRAPVLRRSLEGASSELPFFS